MSAADAGGPAFPVYSPDCGTNSGMTMRDYFAAKAMQVVLHGYRQSTDNAVGEIVAGLSYRVADAMLEARK